MLNKPPPALKKVKEKKNIQQNIKKTKENPCSRTFIATRTNLPVCLNLVDLHAQLFEREVSLRLAQLDSDEFLLQLLHVVTRGSLESQVGLYGPVSRGKGEKKRTNR